jgi:hypothetical protein
VDKEFLGHICTATMMNELEIIAWCYTIYLMLHYQLISSEVTKDNLHLIKFCHPDELVIACAIFAKVECFQNAYPNNYSSQPTT